MAPGSTANGALSPGVSGSPPVRVAVSTTFPSALLYVTPVIAIRLDPAGITPVTMPPSLPEPALTPRRTGVALLTIRTTPPRSRACSTTEKATPAVILAPSFNDETVRAEAGGTEVDVTIIDTARRLLSSLASWI